MCQFCDYVSELMTLFVWISLTALSRTYFIKYIYNKYIITLKLLSVLTNRKLELVGHNIFHL